MRYFTKNIRPHGHTFPPEGTPLDTLEELAPPAKDRLEQLRSMGGNEAKLASQIEKEWMSAVVSRSQPLPRCGIHMDPWRWVAQRQELQAVEGVQRRCAEVPTDINGIHSWI